MKILGWEITKAKKPPVIEVPIVEEQKKIKTQPIDDRPKTTALPAGRVSEPDYDGSTTDLIKGDYAIVTPEFILEIIPLIRNLAYNNPDVSQALHNIVSLGNTGHKVFFDRKVKEQQVDKMRNHLINKRKKWAPGTAGMDGVVNKMFSQLMISGALSCEVVPNPELTGVQTLLLINPENIVFKIESDRKTYKPYQRLRNSILPRRARVEEDLIELNTNTYQYLSLNGDGENPYGIPPYLPVLKRLETQGKMHQNIDFIVDIMGLVGFLEALIEKPDIDGDESEKDYRDRLNTLLTDARSRLLSGMREGVVSGFKDDHEFEFHSASNNYDSVAELFKQNEMQVFTALKQDAALAGRDYGTSEAKANVMFVKMLSELKNVQNIVKTLLEFIYELELRLAGFEFDFLTVAFNRSTLQDDYKYQQAEEIKIRNVLMKFVAGIINMDQAADELGYETPFAKKPLVALELLIGKAQKTDQTQGGKKVSKSGKNKSAKKTRDSRKPVTKDHK